MESKRKIRKRKRRNFLIRILVVFGAVIAAYNFISSSLFDIKPIEVNKNTFYKDEQIVKISGLVEGTNIFKARLSDAEKKLEKEPYIKNAELSRNFPDKILIDVIERKEMASIPYGPKFIVVDNEGIALRTTKQNPNLTIIEGITVNKLTLGEVLHTKDQDDYLSAIKVLNEMAKKGIFFKKIASANGIIKIFVYDQLICKANEKNIINNMDTLKQIIYDLYKKGIERGVINIGDNGYYSFSPIIE